LRGEGQAVGGPDLARLGVRAARKQDTERRQERLRERRRSLAIRLKQSTDIKTISAIRRDLEQLERDMSSAA